MSISQSHDLGTTHAEVRMMFKWHLSNFSSCFLEDLFICFNKSEYIIKSSCACKETLKMSIWHYLLLNMSQLPNCVTWKCRSLSLCSPSRLQCNEPVCASPSCVHCTLHPVSVYIMWRMPRAYTLLRIPSACT